MGALTSFRRKGLNGDCGNVFDQPDSLAQKVRETGHGTVRVLVNEHGMSQFTANNRLQEFKSLVLNGEPNGPVRV